MKRESLSSIIANYRLAHNLSQEDFADLCGVSKANISLLERGINRTTWEKIKPKLETYEKIASGMGISRDELIARVEGKPMLQKVVIKSYAYNVPIIDNLSDINRQNNEDGQLDYINVPDNVYKKDGTIAYKIADDGLSPVMQKNDIVIVWQNEQYLNGDYVLVSSEKENSLKCYKYHKFDYTTVLIGNLSVDPIIQDTTTIILGKVVLVQKCLL